MKTILVIVSTLIFHLTQAQYSGQWTINKMKVDLGRAPEWVLPVKFSIIQNAEDISIKRTVLDTSMLEHDFTETFSGNGNTTTTEMWAGMKRNSSIHRTDNTAFIITTNGIMGDGKTGSSMIEIWSLEDDGKTLVINRHVEQPDGLKYDIRGYYDKR